MQSFWLIISYIFKTAVALFHTHLIALHFEESGLLWLSQWQNAVAFGLVLLEEGFAKFLIRENDDEKTGNLYFYFFLVFFLAGASFLSFLVFNLPENRQVFTNILLFLSFLSVLFFQIIQDFQIRRQKYFLYAVFQLLTAASVLLGLLFFSAEYYFLLLWLPQAVFFVFYTLSAPFSNAVKGEIISFAVLFPEKKALKEMGFLFLIGLIIAVSDKSALLWLRKEVVANFGAEIGGQWQALNTFSAYYWSFIFFFSAKFLYPEMCLKVRGEEISAVKRIQLGLYFISFFFFFIALLLRGEEIMSVFLGKDLSALSSLLSRQVLGDFCRFGSITLGLYLLASGKSKQFAVLQIYLFTTWFISQLAALQSKNIENLVIYAAFAQAAGLLGALIGIIGNYLLSIKNTMWR